MALDTRISPCSRSDIQQNGTIESFECDIEGKTRSSIDEACQVLRQGNVVAIPTETVYGLAADATNQDAVQCIFTAKQRPQDNPLIVHISDIAMLRDFCGTLLPAYEPLISRFWPGPLTILIPKSDKICPAVIGPNDLPTVAVRMPSHPIARALIAKFGRPLAAPSANLSGRPSPTTARHVYADLHTRIPLIMEDVDFTCDVGLESTVIDATQSPPVILRPGGITPELIRQVSGFEHVRVYKIGENGSNKQEEVPTTPGMKYRHYSPKARVILMQDGMMNRASDFLQQGVRVGVIMKTDPNPDREVQVDKSTENFVKFIVGDDGSNETYSRYMFYALRFMDEERVSVIIVESVSDEGMGLALMNRLRKAASEE